MKKILMVIITILICLSPLKSYSVPCQQSIYEGDLQYHNDKIWFWFELTTPTQMSIWTDSYQNGLNFDPVLTLFNNTGSKIGFNDDSQIFVDPINQTSGDSTIVSLLNSGFYNVVLTRYSNYPAGQNLSDGFLYDNHTPIGVNNGFYRLHFNCAAHSGEGQNPVPEPQTIILFLSGLTLFVFVRKRL